MPTLRSIAKIKRKKNNSNDELYLELKMQPLSAETKAQATNAALEDMTEKQRIFLFAKEL